MHPTESAWRQPIPLPDVIGKPSGIPSWIATANAHIRKRSETRRHEYAAALDLPIGKEELLASLSGASPSQGGMNAAGVIADWRMPDEQGPDNRRLLPMHEQALGEPWRIFERYRRLFLQVLTSWEDPFEKWKKCELPFHTAAELETRRIDEAGRLPGRDDMIRALRALLEQRNGAVLGAFAAGKGELKQRTRNRPPEQTDFLWWSNSSLRRFFSKVSESLDDDPHALSSALHGHRYAPVTHPAHRETVYVSRHDYDRYRLDAIRRDEVLSDQGNEARISLVPHGDRSLRMVVTMTNDVRKDLIYALLRWSRDPATGNRQWIYDPLDRGEYAEVHGRFAKTGLDGTDPQRLNPLEGLVVLANLSPAIVGELPRTMGLPGGRYRQDMGAAQVPVLLPMQERQLVQDNPVLDALERWADHGE